MTYISIKRCNYCTGDCGDRYFVCSACKAVQFCSRECAELGEKFHDEVCEFLCKSGSGVVKNTVAFTSPPLYFKQFYK